MRNHLRQSQYICRDIVYVCQIRSKSSKKVKQLPAPYTLLLSIIFNVYCIFLVWWLGARQ